MDKTLWLDPHGILMDYPVSAQGLRLRRLCQFVFPRKRPQLPVSRVAQESRTALLKALTGHATMTFLFPLVAIISIERMIHANHIETDSIKDGTGQLIALSSGMSSMSLAVWEVVKALIVHFRPARASFAIALAPGSSP